MPHADSDDYFWIPSNPPFTRKRPTDERLALMHDIFVPREAWVLSGSLLGWGDSILAQCDTIVFLTLDPQERLRRLEAREIVRREGQEIDQAAWTEFRDWALGYDDPAFDGRSRAGHEEWLDSQTKPVLHLDSALPTEQLVDAVLSWDPR